jgi:hypothetical protein
LFKLKLKMKLKTKFKTKKSNHGKFEFLLKNKAATNSAKFRANKFMIKQIVIYLI